MKQCWTHEIYMVSGAAVLDGLLVVTGASRVDALELDGQLRWRVGLEGAVSEPFVCGDVVVVSAYRRGRGSVVVALDAGGDERWRYERDWSLVSDGLDAGDGDVVMAGTLARTNEYRWVVLSAADGTTRHDVAAPTTGYAKTQSTELTSRGHSTFAVAGQVALLGTWKHDDPPRVAAIDIAQAHERWDDRAPKTLASRRPADGPRGSWDMAASAM